MCNDPLPFSFIMGLINKQKHSVLSWPSFWGCGLLNAMPFAMYVWQLQAFPPVYIVIGERKVSPHWGIGWKYLYCYNGVCIYL